MLMPKYIQTHGFQLYTIRDVTPNPQKKTLKLYLKFQCPET